MKIGGEIGIDKIKPAFFSTNDIAAYLQIPPHSLRYWVRIGLLTANGQIIVGRGSQLMFSITDLHAACLIRRLEKAGLKPQQIKGILAEVSRVQDDPNALVDPLLIPYGATQLIIQRAASGRTMIMDASRPGQYVMTIVLETIDEDVRRILAAAK